MAQVGLRGLEDVTARIIAHGGIQVGLSDDDIGGRSGYQLAHVAEAQDAVIVWVGDVQVRGISRAVHYHARIGPASSDGVIKVELAAFDQVDRIGIEPILSKYLRRRCETRTARGWTVAALPGQHDHAVVLRIRHIELVVDRKSTRLNS